MSNVKTIGALATKLKRARKAVGLSQKQLGEAIKLSDKTVSAYEAGRAQPPVHVLREISKVTYKPVAYFIDEAEITPDDELANKLHRIEQELEEIRAALRRRGE